MSPNESIASPPRATRVLPWGIIAASLTTLAFGVMSTLWKVACTGGPVQADGVTTLGLRAYGSRLCYSDLLVLWQYRELADHAAPYVGTYTADGQITGGVIEYPVLGGAFLWLTGLAADTDGAFILASGIALALCAVAVTVLLYSMCGARAFLWAASPAVLIYTAYNIDILPALATVAAIACVMWGPAAWTGRARIVVAAALLGLGGAIKIYPLMFALPLAIWVAWPRRHGARSFRWGSAIAVLSVAAAAFVIANAPFALLSTEGWLASFQFQSARRVDDNSMALWWWVPHLLGYDVAERTSLLTMSATAATAAAFIVITVASLRRARSTGGFPWIQMSGALLVAFMLFGKVNSPQYILWLLPFLVLVRIPLTWILVYFAVDIAVFFGYFRRFLAWNDGLAVQGLETLLSLGIIVRAALLLYFMIAFVRGPLALRDEYRFAVPERARPSSAADQVAAEGRG